MFCSIKYRNQKEEEKIAIFKQIYWADNRYNSQISS